MDKRKKETPGKDTPPKQHTPGRKKRDPKAGRTPPEKIKSGRGRETRKKKKRGRITCNAKTRTGKPCRNYPIKGRTRCKLHGGRSTGPKTDEGKKKVGETLLTHGAYSRYQPLHPKEKEFKIGLLKLFGEDPTNITKEILVDMAANYMIHIHRGLKWADEKERYWDFSRMGDALKGILREMKTTPLSIEGEDINIKTDLMLLFKELEEKEKKKPKVKK